MENLAFSFDASFGDFLTTLAREKIMTEYDLDAAVKILTDSLSGMSRDQALHILSGECDLSVTSDGSLTIVPVTDEQIEALCRYADAVYGGFVIIDGKSISSYTLRSTEPLMRRRWFE